MSTSPISVKAKEKEYAYLDSLALTAGTDKSSAFHNYTKIYSRYFSELKNKPIKFLEIGLYLGNSVKLWENYFPFADLHFIDIDLSQVQYFSNRATYHHVDQGKLLELCAFLKNIDGNFDIIIDDGGHQMEQQIESFQTLFYRLKSGGMYIIEDLHTSFWKEFGGLGSKENPMSGPRTTTEYLKKIIDGLHSSGARTGCADHQKMPTDMTAQLNDYQKGIESIHFYGSLCLIFKR